MSYSESQVQSNGVYQQSNSNNSRFSKRSSFTSLSSKDAVKTGETGGQQDDWYSSTANLPALFKPPTKVPTRIADAQRWISASKNNGYVRVYVASSPKTSQIIPCTTQTSTQQISLQLGLSSDIYVQFCGDRFQRLEPTDQPLQIQHDFLYTIGYNDVRRIQKMGTSSELGYLVRFLSGLPIYDSSFAYKTKHSLLKVKSNKGLKMWKEKFCIIRGTRLLLFKNIERLSNPSIMYLAKGEVQVDKSRRHCLKIISHLQDGKSYFLEMKDEDQFEKWHRYLKSSTSEIPNAADLSHSNLEFIPKPLLDHNELATLNLRHNLIRVSNEEQMQETVQTGKHRIEGSLQDLTRFQFLQNLNLSDNNLEHFPECICQLRNLKDLTLSMNHIVDVPHEIGALIRLECLRLDNNLLWSLPEDIQELPELILLDLSFNQFTTIPEVICSMGGSATPSIYLAGNQVTSIQDTLPAMRTIQKLDLRLNSLTFSHTETKLFGCFECLTHLDLRNNSVAYLNLLSVKTLEYLDCSWNKITEICLNGSSLKLLMASQNLISRLLIEPKPALLEDIDLSHNALTEIPNYFSHCYFLNKLLVSHNKLTFLPKNLFTERSSKLKILIAHHNEISHLPREIEHVSLEEVDLHCNRLTELHEHFLYLSPRLRILNLSQNCIETLPPMEYGEDRHRIQELYLSFNKLNNDCLEVISCYKRLQILHLAFNYITELYPEFIQIMYTLREVNVSGNELQELPEELLRLPFLTILRAHCNKLVTLPDNIQDTKLKILDLGSNYILGPSLVQIMDSNLDFLDISGNEGPGVSLNDFNEIKGKRRVRLIDMTGDDRLVPGVVPHGLKRNQGQLNLLSGMAETAGNRNKLCISVVKRLHCPTPDSALFAIFDGGLNDLLPRYLQHNFLQAYLEELRRCRDNSETLRYTLLTLHKSLRAVGQRLGASAAVVTLKQSASTSWHENSQSKAAETSWNWKVDVANMGDIRVAACRAGRVEMLSPSCRIEENINEQIRVKNSGGVITSDNKINGVTPSSRLLGASFLYPSVLPNPLMSESVTCMEGDSLILASRGLWEHVSPEEAFGEIQGIENPVAASKRLMDLAQAFGSKENLTVLVVLFNSQSQNEPETTLPNVGIHDKEIYTASSMTSGNNSERLIHSTNFSRLPLDEFARSENSMSIQSNDSFKRVSDPAFPLTMQNSMTTSANQHRYKKRNEAFSLLEQQMKQRISTEVKEKEFSAIFGDENSEEGDNETFDHEKENKLKSKEMGPTWFTSVKRGEENSPDNYQGQKFGLFKGGVTSRTLLNDKSFIMTAPGYAGSNFDSEEELISNVDRVGDASINPASESADSDEEEFLHAAMSHDAKKKHKLFKRKSKSHSEDDGYVVHDYVRSETPKISKVLTFNTTPTIIPSDHESSTLSSRASSTSTLTHDKANRSSFQNQGLPRTTIVTEDNRTLTSNSVSSASHNDAFIYATGTGEQTRLPPRELFTGFGRSAPSTRQSDRDLPEPHKTPNISSNSYVPQMFAERFPSKSNSSQNSDYETLDKFSQFKSHSNSIKTTIPPSPPTEPSTWSEDDNSSYENHVYATLGPRQSILLQPEDRVTHL